MKIVIIDDSERFAEYLSSTLAADPSAVVVKIPVANENQDHSSYHLARKISDELAEDDGVIFINLNLKDGIRENQQLGLRHQQKGAEVLKYLRLTESFFDEETNALRANNARFTSCVVYSFLSLEQILRQKPENAVLVAEGTTLVQLPIDFSHLELENLVRKKTQFSSFQSHLRGGSFIPDDRHDLANWWGIKKLWDVHRLVVNKPTEPYPRVVYEELKKIENIQAVSQYGENDSSINSVFSKQKEEIEGLRAALIARRPRVLHIDDQWENGWSHVFMQMIHTPAEAVHPPVKDLPDRPLFDVYSLGGNPVYNVFKNFPESVAPVGDAQIHQMFQKISNFIGPRPENMPDVVLLDLRLFGDTEGGENIGDFSGAKLLARFRQKFKSIPVVMTTASNKAWNFERLLQLGADGYWTKEGVDGRNSQQDSIDNYLKFLNIIEKVTGDKYKLLTSLFKEITRLKEITKLNPRAKHWWEDKTWKSTGKTTTVNAAKKQLVFDYLEETFQMLRTYLFYFEMGYGFQSSESQKFWSMAIVRHASIILDFVHRLTGGIGSRTIGDERGDWLGKELYLIRNLATHKDRDLGWEEMLDFLLFLCAYLRFGPQDAFKDGMKLNEFRIEEMQISTTI